MALVPEITKLKQSLENIIQDTGVATTTSPSFTSGQNLVLTTTAASNAGAEVLTSLDISIYQDSVLAANLFPGGANISLGAWIFLGPYSDYASNNGKNQVYKTALINVSAGSHVIIFKTNLRAIQNTVSTVAVQS